MSIRRAMPVIRTDDLDASRRLYVDTLGFEVAMEETGFLMLRSPSTPTTQLLLLAEDSRDPAAREVDVSIEVADVDAVHAAAVAGGQEIVYAIRDEPWGVRRFFVRDPSGHTINVVSHR